MPYGMYISGEGARVQAQRLEVIANNLANVETPGFKRDVPMFQSRFAEAIQDGNANPGSGSINDVGGGVKMISTETDFSRGGIRQTKTPTDFAINGEGFFHVRGGDGEVYLTRAGNFALDANGRLQTQTNLPVLDDAGGEIVIDTTRPWSLDSGGRITQDGDSRQLGLSSPQSLGDLVKMGSNLFRSLGPTTPIESVDVRQGYLEQSGVNPTREMMAMIETSRAFEANTKIIQHQDSMISGLLSRVLAS